MTLLLVLIFCFHFLLLVSSQGDSLNPCAGPNSTICANLKDVRFPFGAIPSCGASSSFLLSNCTTQQAYWYNFNEAIGDTTTSEPAPAVMGIYNGEGDYGFVNLTWGNVNLSESQACTPADHLPNTINLTAFADSAFRVSPNNIYLLFDCTNSQSHPTLVEENTTACQAYIERCMSYDTSCFQLKPDKELMLQYVMEKLSCTQFQFLVTLDISLPVTQWRHGMVQLTWNQSTVLSSDSACENCEKTNGTCGYDDHNNFECFCPGNQNSSTDCAPQCTGRLICSTGSKIATGVVVSVVAFAILVVLALCCLRRRSRKVSTRSVPTVSSDKLWTQRALCLSSKFGPVPTNEFSYEELLQATESFSDEKMIGDGGFGAVYVGFLRDGRKVAIKRLYHDNFRRMDQFYNEMKILSALQHPNLVKLYGFCCQDERDLLLVFEYASKGTVADQLHDVTKPSMPWKIRLNIAWETAEALSYLHNSLSPPIYHRDVKTTNILLDENFHAKLADFGLSRLVPLEVTHVSTAPQGTPGYVDPDYHQCYQLTDKSDVYSFGVVLMELVSAKLAVDMSRNRREINLSSLALMKIASGAWEELVDPRLEMGRNAEVERMAKGVVELAFQCLQGEKDDRPNMSVVAETLANLRRESGYGYEELINNPTQYSKVDIHVPSSTEETIHLMKHKSAYNSPNSVLHSSSVWTSSSTSSNLSSF